MKTIYFECNMGAAGDMLMAALLELHPDREAFIKQMNGLGLPGVEVHAHPAEKCGIRGTHVSVAIHGEHEHSEDVPHSHDHGHDHAHSHDHDHGHDHGHTHEHSHDHGHSHEHSHHGMHNIEHIIGRLPVSDRVKADARAVYGLIAEAESHAHGRPVLEIHFHEVGTMDAVADVVGVCLLMEALAPERVFCSPVHVGSGQVRCAHGILPVPAPATAFILQGVPTYGGSIMGELCTPTGAALLKHFVHEFGQMPILMVSATGYGMGKKDFPAANCVRAFLGETPSRHGEVSELLCNLDDMTPEALGFAQQMLFDHGALDVYTTAIGMKKNRPGILLTCMCRQEQRDEMIRLLFKHTTTLGVREYTARRYTLERSEDTLDTAHGPVRVKRVNGYGIEREKLEYEDIARIARSGGQSLAEVTRDITRH